MLLATENPPEKGCKAHHGSAITVGMSIEARGPEGTDAAPKVEVPAVDLGQPAHVGQADGGLLFVICWPGGAGRDKV